MCPHWSQALQLLGKLGGRNRRFLAEPLELELKDNPEHGLRLILTFQPQTSFLVPLDRCLALSAQSLLAADSARPLPPLALCLLAPACMQKLPPRMLRIPLLQAEWLWPRHGQLFGICRALQASCLREHIA